MNKLLLLAVLLMVTTVTAAQSARDSVLTTVNNLFAAMKEADSTKLAACFAPGASLKTVREGADGLVTMADQPIAGFVSMIGQMEKGAADEQVSTPAIHIDGALAVVWTPYRFLFKGNFSHCGVNVFQLIRVAGGWKILSIVDTRRKTDCPT